MMLAQNGHGAMSAFGGKSGSWISEPSGRLLTLSTAWTCTAKALTLTYEHRGMTGNAAARVHNACRWGGGGLAARC